jgi:MGT family glycosyltransferase
LDFEAAVRRNGLDYRAVGASVFPLGTIQDHYAELGALRGVAALRYLVSYWIRRSKMLFAEAPGAVREAGIDLLLVDQAEMAGACVADRLELPFITLSNALVANREPAVPPVFTGWPYATNMLTRLRNDVAYRFQERLTREWLAVHNQQRQQWRLPLYRIFEDSTSSWAHLSQQPSCFDFPRAHLPQQFHYTGPWHDRNARPAVPFPYEKLSGKPLIYASMGTLQNRIHSVFRAIALACEGLEAQLVVSLGGGATPEELGALPGNPLVVSYVPQLELLARASLTITHAGLNTALESLSCGVPMVAIPVGNDQPGVAARIKWLGAGEVVPLSQLSAGRLRPLVIKALTNDRYRQRARQLQQEIQKADGVRRAIELIERVLIDKKPVLRN